MGLKSFKNFFLSESASQDAAMVFLKKNIPDDVDLRNEIYRLDRSPSKGDVPAIFSLYKQSENLDVLGQYLKQYYSFKSQNRIKRLNPDYLKFTEEIDKIAAKKSNSLQKTKVNRDINSEDLLVDNEEIQILKAHNKNACIQYGAGYSFCISRPGGGNMYYGYRLNQASTFYFIFFKKVPHSDPKHIMVLDKNKNGWMVTYADNDTQSIDWEDVVEDFPILKQYEKLFIVNPFTDEELARAQRVNFFKKSPSLKNFNELNYEEKGQALSELIDLPDYIFETLDSNLRNEYISSGGNLTKLQTYSLIPKEIERYKKVRAQVVPNLPEKNYKFNEFDIEIPFIQQKIKEDHVLAIDHIKKKSASPDSGQHYYLSNLLLVQLPSLHKLTEQDSLDIVNCQLTSLRGCPKKLWAFHCVDNPSLESLEGGPEKVTTSYDCTKNGLTSLKGAPKIVGTEFNCSDNALTTLEGGPEQVSRYDCSSNRLISLKGAPEKVGVLDCSFNLLKSLKDGPKWITNILDIGANSIEDVEHVPLILSEKTKKVRLFSDYGDDRLYGVMSVSLKISHLLIDSLNKKLKAFVDAHPDFTIAESVFKKFDNLLKEYGG